MRKIILLSLAYFLYMECMSQSLLQHKTDSVKNLVVEFFNKKDAENLYNLSGEAFRKQLTLPAFKTVCETNLFPLGKINDAKFESNKKGVSKYKTSFNAAVLSMYLGLDSVDKIYTFLFQAYQADAETKKEKPITSNPLLTNVDKKVDEVIGTYIQKANTVGVSVGVLQDGKTYYYNYGETVKGNGQLPTEKSIYEIGSISKTFTAILLASTVNAGKIKLDDPINMYLPDSIGKLGYDGTPITIQTLSNHSSGLPRLPSNLDLSENNEVNPYKNYDASMLFSFLKNFKPIRKPGSEYEYSNLAAGLLGTILERVNKKPYEDLLIEKICNPLQMNDTREFIKRTDSARFVQGYDENGNRSSQWDFKALAGAGGIRSTASDLLKYAGANINTANKQLNDAMQLTHVVTFQPSSAKVSLGWHILKPGNDEILFHNGGTVGFRTYLAINPIKKFAVVILSNAAISDDEQGNELMKWLETQ